MRAGLACDGGAAAAAALEDAELTIVGDPAPPPPHAQGEAVGDATPAVASVPSSPRVTPIELCTTILKSLMKRRDAHEWFNAPVPAGTEGYSAVVSNPIDYGTILMKLESGTYLAQDGPAADGFARDVRCVASNAIAYSPQLNNLCNRAAHANLVAFEKAFVKAGLANDGGAALKQAEEAAGKGSPEARVTRNKRPRGS